MKIAAYILAFYILFSAIVPCSFFDNCEQDEINIAYAEKKNTKPENCNNCSPFSVCASCSADSIPGEPIAIKPLLSVQSPVFVQFNADTKSGYHFSFLRPPRMA